MLHLAWKEVSLMLWAFDTEDDSQGRVYWLDFFNGTEHVSFDHPHRAIEWMLDQEGEFWAVNLEYDLINLFGPLLDQLCILTYGGFGLLKATLHGRPVKFFNTLRHWQMSVEEMGERLGYPKLPFDPTNLKYCQRDTEVTYLFIREMLARYQMLGIEDVRPTLPGTSMKLFTSKFCKAEYFRHPSYHVWDFLSKSRYGGRCEVFCTQPVRGGIHEADINSSYPYQMKTAVFPDLESINTTVSTPHFDREGVATVRMKAPNIEFPLLPHRREEDGKLLFPIGSFAGTWTYPEIRKALTLGYTIEKFYRAVEYRSMSSPFSTYIDFMYGKRQEVKDTDALLSYTLKIFMNSLYGKWGEQGDLQIISKGKRHTMSNIPKHSNMVWATYILAYGRMALYDHMMSAAQHGPLLYCDTDSVFVKSPQCPFAKSGKLGDLSHKGTYAFAHFKLPKLYRIDKKYKAKGVPLDRKSDFPDHLKKEFFYDGIAEFQKPYRFMEARKLKEQPNVWREVSKQINSNYDKRMVFENGKTWPLKIT